MRNGSFARAKLLLYVVWLFSSSGRSAFLNDFQIKMILRGIEKFVKEASDMITLVCNKFDRHER